MDVADSKVALAGRRAPLHVGDYPVSRNLRTAASTARRLCAGAAVLAAAMLLNACGGGADVDPVTAADASGATGDQRMVALAATGTTVPTTPVVSGNTVWTACAAEGQTCAFTGTRQVRFGTASTGVVRTFTGGTVCANGLFGDPIGGGAKSCSSAAVPSAAAFDASIWAMCASEGGTCVFTGTRLVRYGSTTLGVTQVLTNRTACSDAVFGDPAPGAAKACWYSTEATTLDTWTPCASEGQTCTFSGTRMVRYGTSTNYKSGTYSNSVACSNATFGDPVPGTVKSCSYSSTQTASSNISVPNPTPTPTPTPAPTPVPTPVPAPVVTVPLAQVTIVALGTRAQLVASFNGSQVSDAADVIWAAADPTVATVSAAGLATPLRAGYTTVTATLRGQTVTSTLSVRGSTLIPTRSQYVGTNLGGVSYHGANFPFSNVMKSSSGFYSSGSTSPLATDSDGNPTSLLAGQRARTNVMWTNTRYPSGQYTVLWDGDGTISFPLSNISINSSAPNRIVITPTRTDTALYLQIDTTNPANPVRNVRFLLPGTESTYATQPFNPTYLQKIAPFSMLRFMDWGQTNGSSVVEWADRAQPTALTFGTSKGVSIEAMIDLANTLHVDPWICIPHMASDDYVRQFATLLHARLDPTLRPRIEYSNEVWNFGFSQTQWAKAQSAAAGLSMPWGMPSIFYGKRAAQMFKIMQQVYAGDSARLVRVLGGQAVWTQFQQNALGYADTAANVDVLAIAPYFSAETAAKAANVDATLALNADQIIDQMLVAIRGPVKAGMTANAALAAQNRIKLEAYESGPGDSTFYFPAAKQDAVTALFAAANANPRMKSVYIEYYTQWKAAGGGAMNQFSDVAAWSKWGFWGALEYTFQDVATSPKYQGLMAFIAANPGSNTPTTLGTPAGSTR